LKVRVRSPQDLGAAGVFVIVGVAGLIFGQDLAFGTAAKMGPGYFPMILSGIIVAIGVILAIQSLAVDGPPIERVHIRPLLFIVGAIIASGYLLQWVGLVITAVIMTLVAAYARRGAEFRENLLLGAGLSIFSALIFVYALSQPLPLWWGD
jgi:hypothetical protein